MKRIGFLLSTALYAVAAATLPAHADAFLDEAKALVAKATAPASAWDGPTAGPARKIRPSAGPVLLPVIMLYFCMNSA